MRTRGGVRYRGASQSLRRLVTNYYGFCPSTLTNLLEEKREFCEKHVPECITESSLPFTLTSSTLKYTPSVLGGGGLLHKPDDNH